LQKGTLISPQTMDHLSMNISQALHQIKAPSKKSIQRISNHTQANKTLYVQTQTKNKGLNSNKLKIKKIVEEKGLK